MEITIPEIYLNENGEQKYRNKGNWKQKKQYKYTPWELINKALTERYRMRFPSQDYRYMQKYSPRNTCISDNEQRCTIVRIRHKHLSLSPQKKSSLFPRQLLSNNIYKENKKYKKYKDNKQQICINMKALQNYYNIKRQNQYKQKQLLGHIQAIYRQDKKLRKKQYQQVYIKKNKRSPNNFINILNVAKINGQSSSQKKCQNRKNLNSRFDDCDENQFSSKKKNLRKNRHLSNIKKSTKMIRPWTTLKFQDTF